MAAFMALRATLQSLSHTTVISFGPLSKEKLSCSSSVCAGGAAAAGSILGNVGVNGFGSVPGG